MSEDSDNEEEKEKKKYPEVDKGVQDALDEFE